MSKGKGRTKKKAPKIHTKKLEIHLEFGDDKILVDPADTSAYKHFKRWCYRNLPSRNIYWDNTAELYVIDLEKGDKTRDDEDIETALRRDFTVLDYLPGGL